MIEKLNDDDLMYHFKGRTRSKSFYNFNNAFSFFTKR